MGTARGRWVLTGTVLGSGMAFIDSTVVNVALPAIGRSFHSSLESLQWTVTAYMLTLSAFILVGGSLGDRYGRRRIFVIGILWFAAASLLCGLAPTALILHIARALQGVGGALLTPGSLAILQASFRPRDRAQAIGAWSGLGGIAGAIGPFVGGYLIQAVSWRLIFFINLPLAAIVVWITERHMPESSDPDAAGRPDFAGALLAVAGLGGVIFALIEGPSYGWTSAPIIASLLAGVAGLVAFVIVERRLDHPMLPLSIFKSRQFTGANIVTLFVYAALGGALFLVPIQLQQVLHYSPLEAGIALLPITGIMLALSAQAGKLAQRIGPRLPMTVGPIVAGGGLALLSRVDAGTTYVSTFLPAIIVFSLGLALTVAPLTATVLATAPVEHAGLASAVNNTVARAAGLIAVSVLPVAAGLTGAAYLHADIFQSGYRTALFIGGGLCAAGGVLAFVTIDRGGAAIMGERSDYSCPIESPPLSVRETPPPEEAGEENARAA